MMKFFLLVAFVLATSSAYTVRRIRSEEVNDEAIVNSITLNVTQLIKKEGYPVEEYTVLTSDGYILDLIRIPYGIKPSPYKSVSTNDIASWQSTILSLKNDNSEGNNNKKYEFVIPEDSEDDDQSKSGNDENPQGHGTTPLLSRKPVLLVADFVSNSEDFVIDGSQQGLAFILADAGYDVYLANVRGSTYGLRHTRLDPQRDAAFWRFSLDDIGTKDLPAIVDKVLEVSKERTLSYIGHMHGATAFYIMASEKVEYQDKILSMISLGPIAFLEHSTNKVLKQIADHLDHPGWIIANMGQSRFFPSLGLLTSSSLDCLHIQQYIFSPICSSQFFLLTGYNSKMLNETTVGHLIRRRPSQTSTKEMLQLAYILKSGKFAKCLTLSDNKCEGGHEYDLGKIQTPISFIVSREDSLSSFLDLKTLINKLGKPVLLDDTGYSNNLDLLHGKYVEYVVAPAVITMLVAGPQNA